MRGLALFAAGIVLFGSGFLASCRAPSAGKGTTVVPETNVIDGTTLRTRCRTVTMSDGRFDVTCTTAKP